MEHSHRREGEMINEKEGKTDIWKFLWTWVMESREVWSRRRKKLTG